MKHDFSKPPTVRCLADLFRTCALCGVVARTDGTNLPCSGVPKSLVPRIPACSGERQDEMTEREARAWARRETLQTGETHRAYHCEHGDHWHVDECSAPAMPERSFPRLEEHHYERRSGNT